MGANTKIIRNGQLKDPMKVAFNEEKAFFVINCETLNFAFPAVLAGGHDVMRLMLSAPRPSISWKDNILVTSRGVRNVLTGTR